VVLFLVNEVYVSEQLSSRKIMELLDKYPDLEKIRCPQSLYLRISKKYLEALSELGIEVEPVTKIGRPKKYTEESEDVQKLLDEGKSPKEISEILKISLKTVYYLKNSKLKRGRKSKYPPETEDQVKKLYHDGVPTREISQNLEIPLRTVYYFLKR